MGTGPDGDAAAQGPLNHSRPLTSCHQEVGATRTRARIVARTWSGRFGQAKTISARPGSFWQSATTAPDSVNLSEGN